MVNIFFNVSDVVTKVYFQYITNVSIPTKLNMLNIFTKYIEF